MRADLEIARKIDEYVTGGHQQTETIEDERPTCAWCDQRFPIDTGYRIENVYGRSQNRDFCDHECGVAWVEEHADTVFDRIARAVT